MPPGHEPNAADREAEYLSTVGALDPRLVFERVGARPAVMVAVAVWAADGPTGRLEEKGRWVREFWRAVSETVPEAEGVRRLWNTLFFLVPAADPLQVKERFRAALNSVPGENLRSFCVLAPSSGDPQRDLLLLDEMESEISSARSFGRGAQFEHRLLDGREPGHG